MKSLNEIGEFKLIDSIKKSITTTSSAIINGIGDDCAVIAGDNKNVYLISTDLLIEGVHFELEYFSACDIATKAVAVNVSDIAAMGGRPKFITVSIALDKNSNLHFFKDFYAGVKRSCKKYDIDLIGGDTSSSKNGIFISITIIGEAKNNEYLLRNGAKPGESIYVTGNLGDSSGGLDILKNKYAIDEKVDKFLVKRHLTVSPRVDEGAMLAASKSVSSMIDLSDGVGSDIQRICEESNVGAEIFAESIPVSKQLKSLSKVSGKDVLDYALYGGEDYELMLTVKEGDEKMLESDFRKQFKKKIYRIGKIVEGERAKLKDINGIYHNISNGYNHFLN